MAVTDDVKVLTDRFWAILLASDDFTETVRTMNRVNVSAVGGRQRVPQPKPAARGAADFPEVKIERGRSRLNPFAGSVTFATFQGSPTARIRQRTQEVVITIATADLGDVAAGQVLAIVEGLVEAAGPQLGIPATVSLVQEIAGEHRLVNNRPGDPSTTGGAGWRRQVTVTVSLLCRSSV